MKNSRDLFDLIQSLSKAEKRYTRMRAAFHEGEKRYMTLFAILENQETYDPEDLRVKWEKQSGGRSLGFTKSYLYDFILGSLEQFHASSNHVADIQTLLRRVDVLFDKALYGQCVRLLIKARKLAEKHYAIRLLLEVQVWELRIMLSPYYGGEFKRSFAELFHSEQEILQSLNHISIARQFRFMLEDDPDVLETGQPEELPFSNKPNVLCEVERSKAVFYMKANKPRKALQAIESEIEMLESEALKGNRVFYSKYVNSLGLAIKACQELKDYEASERYLERLHPQHQPKDLDRSEHLRLRMFVNFYIQKLRHLCLTGKTGELDALLGEIEATRYYEDERLQSSFRVQLQYLMSIAYFKTGQCPNALKALNSLLMAQSSDLPGRLKLNASWLQMLIHQEKNNMDTVEHLLRAQTRRLKKAEESLVADEVLSKLFQGLIRCASKAERDEVFGRASRAWAESMAEGQLIPELDLGKWLHRKAVPVVG